MNLRDRAWRRKMADLVEALERHIETAEIDDAERIRLIGLKERLAGTLGSDEGWTTTPQLRERARKDYAMVAKILGQASTELDVPEGDPATEVYERRFASIRRARPRRGDRS